MLIIQLTFHVEVIKAGADGNKPRKRMWKLWRLANGGTTQSIDSVVIVKSLVVGGGGGGGECKNSKVIVQHTAYTTTKRSVSLLLFLSLSLSLFLSSSLTLRLNGLSYDSLSSAIINEGDYFHPSESDTASWVDIVAHIY